MFDLLIRNAQIIDGSGKQPFSGDLAVQGDRIADIGDLPRADARTVINANGACLSPGFIDVHSHSDTYLLIEPSSPSKTTQGISTEVVGNCGASGAPIHPPARMPSDWADKKYPAHWNSVAEYRKVLEQVKPAPNVVLLAGHNTLRGGVAGYENRMMTPEELHLARQRLRAALSEGASGFSTGLIYPPGMFAPREEIIELCKVVAEAGGIYTSHMRSEGSGLLAAIEEAIDIGRKSGVRVEISHLKTSGRKNWPLLDNALSLIRQARKQGQDIAADRYPYNFSSTNMDSVLPAWAQEGTREDVLARLKSPSSRQRILDALSENRSPAEWARVSIGSTFQPEALQFRGRPVTELAGMLKVPPAEAVLHLLEQDSLRTSAFFFGMSEENMLAILSEPYVMVGCDASLRAPEGPLGQDYPHPRAYGTFPRFLRMVLDGKLLSLPEAVRKITSLPAEHFRLKNRGVIRKNACADLVVFDPAVIRDQATCASPHQFSTGILHLIVNGVPTLQDGKLTGIRGGRFLAAAGA
jgi:N-acyl-D-amino-acid deacylase